MDAGGQNLNTADRNDGVEPGGDQILVVRDVSKQFGGTQALSDVGMYLRAGEILALLGENGAGKSTLIKILAEVYTLDKGTVTFRGADVTNSLRHLPIAFIHQDLGLIDWMTVAENICLTLGFPRRRSALAGGSLAGNARRRGRPRRTDPEFEPNREVSCRDRQGALRRG